jgi:tRNA(Ile)-lysidine synthase
MSTIENRDLENECKRFLQHFGVSTGDRILVGLSGGPDSTALFYIINELSDCLAIEMSGIYVDHGIRTYKERRRELERIREIEKDTGKPVFTRFCTPGVIAHAAARRGAGVEAAARLYRYKIFGRVMQRFGFDYLLLGHTLNDQIETMVVRFFQGSGPEGLKGMPRRRDVTAGGNTPGSREPSRSGGEVLRREVLRPFLGAKKEEIFAYLEGRGIRFVTDSTNTHLNFLRNRVRKELLPAAAAVFPGMGSALTEMGDRYGAITDFIRSETEKKLPVRRSGTGWSVSLDAFRAAHQVVREQAVYNLTDCLFRSSSGCRESRIPYAFVREICSIAAGKRKDSRIHSGHGLQFVVEKDELKVIPYVVNPEKKGYLLVVKDPFERGIRRSGFQIEKILLSSLQTDNWIFEHDRLYPLLIRSWRYGDRIKIRGGTKEVRKLFQEWRVPDSRKWDIPIVESPGGIEAVFGSFFGFPNRTAVPQEKSPKQKEEKVLVFSYADYKDGIFE